MWLIATLHDWVFWILGLFGLGGVGFVTMLFFAPEVALLVEEFVLKSVEILLGSRIGCAAIALLVGLVVGDIHRSSLDESAIAAADAKYEAAAKERDARIDASTLSNVESANVGLQKELESLQSQVASHVFDPSDPCKLSDSDLEFLRGLIGAGAPETPGSNHFPMRRIVIPRARATN